MTNYNTLPLLRFDRFYHNGCEISVFITFPVLRQLGSSYSSNCAGDGPNKIITLLQEQTAMEMNGFVAKRKGNQFYITSITEALASTRIVSIGDFVVAVSDYVTTFTLSLFLLDLFHRLYTMDARLSVSSYCYCCVYNYFSARTRK